MTGSASRGRPRLTARIDPEAWVDFGEAAASAEPAADRSELLRQFIDWYRRKPGARLPQRPQRKTDAEPAGHDPVP
jgi:hypothetical protein